MTHTKNKRVAMVFLETLVYNEFIFSPNDNFVTKLGRTLSPAEHIYYFVGPHVKFNEDFCSIEAEFEISFKNGDVAVTEDDKKYFFGENKQYE